jgi:hypothetical protein
MPLDILVSLLYPLVHQLLGGGLLVDGSLESLVESFVLSSLFQSIFDHSSFVDSGSSLKVVGLSTHNFKLGVKVFFGFYAILFGAVSFDHLQSGFHFDDFPVIVRLRQNISPG